MNKKVKNLILCAIPFSAGVVFFNLFRKSLKHPHKHRYMMKAYGIALLIIFPLALLSSICTNLVQSAGLNIIIGIAFLFIVNFCLSVGFMKYMGEI